MFLKSTLFKLLSLCIKLTKCGINLRFFLPKFCEVDQEYPTRFSKNSFYYKRSACKTTSFAITLGGPTIQNSFLSQHEKSISHLVSFLKQIKFKLLNSSKNVRQLSSLTSSTQVMKQSSTKRLRFISMSDVTLQFICLTLCFSSMLNEASSDSLFDKLTLISDLNDLLVLDDYGCSFVAKLNS